MAGDEDSDEDMGKPAGPGDSEGLDYDSDEKNDEELVAVSGSTQSNELIDLGGDDSGANQAKKAASIPKLSGPK